MNTMKQSPPSTTPPVSPPYRRLGLGQKLIALVEMMIETAFLFGQSMVLVYPLLLFILLASFFLADIPLLLTDTRALLTTMGVILLLYVTFASGWFNMIAAVVTNFFKFPSLLNDSLQEVTSKEGDGAGGSTPLLDPSASNEEKARQEAVLKEKLDAKLKEMESQAQFQDALSLMVEPWKSFESFFPGVGQYFLPTFLGVFIHLVAFFLLFIVIPQGLLTNNFQLGQWLEQSLDQMRTVNVVMLVQWATLGSALYGIFFFLTVFWVPILFTQQVSLPQAFVKSLQIFWKDPLPTACLVLFYLSVFFFIWLTWLISSELNVLFVPLLMQFSLIMFNLYVLMLIFVYTVHVLGTPAPAEPSPALKI